MKETGENKLGTWPVGKLLLSMSLPMMVSFFIQAMYNVVDSIFVARISENALTAVSLAFSMQMLMHAIAVGIGVGVNACVSAALGKGNREKAGKVAGTAIALDFCFMILFMILGFTAARPIYAMQTDLQEIVDYGATYLSIIWIVCAGELFGQLLEKMLVATGNAFLAMMAMASGAVFNIIFDPLLIFGLGPFPEMGIAGAALATVLGQILAAAVSLYLNVRKNTQLKVTVADLRLHSEELSGILSVGFPSMVTIGFAGLSNFLVNQVLLTYSTTATAVYGIWTKLQNFCYMPLFGMNNGMVPILSYNLASERKDRVHETFRLAMTAAFFLECALLMILEQLPEPLLRLFDASDSMLSIGVRALRVCILSLPLGGITVIMTSSMQSLRHQGSALFINILRQFVLIYGAFRLLSELTHDLGQVWFAVPLSECICCVIAAFFIRRLYRDLGIRAGKMAEK